MVAKAPANPRGLEEELEPQKKEKREFEKIRSEIINENPSSELRFAMNANQLAFLKKLKNSEYSSYRDFAEWVERKRNAADFNQLSMRTRMSSSERQRYILKFLDQKGDLNDSIIEDWVSSRKDLEQKKLANEARKKEAQDKKQSIVQSGSVLKDGFYQKPSSQSDCPSGYRFFIKSGLVRLCVQRALRPSND